MSLSNLCPPRCPGPSPNCAKLFKRTGGLASIRTPSVVGCTMMIACDGAVLLRPPTAKPARRSQEIDLGVEFLRFADVYPCCSYHKLPQYRPILCIAPTVVLHKPWSIA
jgi:hypothetical protein